MSTSDARAFHAVLEPVATSVFFAPEPAAEYEGLGLSATEGYFCSRAAPMGRVAVDVVAATFYSFSADVVRANVRWDVASPERVLEARSRGARAAMNRMLGEVAVPGGALDSLRDVVAACRLDGRPLAAAHASLPWPDDPPSALWHAASVLREFRGDGHIAVLLSHGIDAPSALVLDAAYAGKSERWLASRNFPAEEIRTATDRLRDRAFLDASGALTEGGAKFREMLEIDTDRLAAPPFASLGGERARATVDALVPVARVIVEQRVAPRFVQQLFARAFSKT